MPTIIITRQTPASSFEDELAARCAGAGFSVLLLPDLYQLPEDSPCWAEVTGLTELVAVFSRLHPRPLGWLLHRHGVAVPALLVNMAANVDELLAALPASGVATAGEIREITETTTARWYPLIDGERCENCHHCLQFCLFGVYALDESERVRVCRPDACKPGCPACSRICPHGAIIFPLYRDAAIAGAPGVFMAPDAAARRMYYVRSKQPCPRCGQVAEGGKAPAETACCPECGSPLAPLPAAPPDDIDLLIEELDRLVDGSKYHE